jgi:hypothetical protein
MQSYSHALALFALQVEADGAVSAPGQSRRCAAPRRRGERSSEAAKQRHVPLRTRAASQMEVIGTTAVRLVVQKVKLSFSND